jgi:predicted phage terminase large subunit-like protein
MAHDPARRTWRLTDGSTIHAGSFQLQHILRFREQPGQVEKLIVATAKADGPQTRVVMEQDPGQAGKSQIAHYKQLLAGIAPFSAWPPSGSKIVRAEAPSGAAQQGRISIVRGGWNEDWFDEAEQFPGVGVHDDQVDAVSGAFAVLEQGSGVATVTKPTAVSTRAVGTVARVGIR